jgi:DNA-binding transcriptional LysR family regulator
VARKIGAVQRVVVASPAYLQTAGTPHKPNDLRSHSLIVGPAGRAPEAWTFYQGGSATSIRPQGHFVINGNEAVIAAAVAGLGIASAGLLGLRSELERGTLVRLLPEYRMGSVDIHVILPAGRSSKPSVRAFSHFSRRNSRTYYRTWT